MFAFKLKIAPAQMGELLEAVAAGFAITSIEVVVVLEQFPLETVSETTNVPAEA